jgi:hypothetical protein
LDRSSKEAIRLVTSNSRADVPICASPARLLDGDWLSHCGEVESFAVEDYGALKSLRVFYRSGLEVESGLADPTWARAPLDPGTESVLAGGARVLYDPSYVFPVAKDAAVTQQPVAADDHA